MDVSFDSLAGRLRSRENAALAVAIPLAIMAAYASSALVASSTVAMLAMFAVGIQVPLSLSNNEQLPAHRPTLLALVAIVSVGSWVLLLATTQLVAPRFGSTAGAVSGYIVALIGIETAARAPA
jgi:hypothetical protein